MSRYDRRDGLDCKVYVGDLQRDTTEKDIERAFSYYGPLKSVWVARNPSGFAFVEFEDSRDAEDAIKELDGTKICGVHVRVEASSGKTRPKPWMRRGPAPRGRRPFDSGDKCYQCGERGHYAYDCTQGGSGGRRGGGGSYGGGSRRRSRSRSYERSRRRSYSRSPSRSRSRSRSRGRSSRHSRDR